MIIHGDCLEEMKKMGDKCIDLTLTSPPYDNLRDYKGFVFNFEGVAKEIYRITKDGGVVVWIVGDATINGSETGSSFKQALFFKEIGFNLHDTMVWNKNGFSAVGALRTRYAPVFEFMFIFTKGKIKTFNPIKDKPNKWVGDVRKHAMNRQSDGTTTASKGYSIGKYGQRYNIWQVNAVRQRGENVHPAPFPESLANDHIISWSNEGDTVLDPFAGSGTTLKMAKKNKRQFIGIEISKEYVGIVEKRIASIQESMF